MLACKKVVCEEEVCTCSGFQGLGLCRWGLVCNSSKFVLASAEERVEKRQVNVECNFESD